MMGSTQDWELADRTDQNQGVESAECWNPHPWELGCAESEDSNSEGLWLMGVSGTEGRKK